MRGRWAILIVLLLCAALSGCEESSIATRDKVERQIVNLSDDDWSVRWNAAHELKLMGSEAELALPALIERLADANLEVWKETREAIVVIADSPYAILISTLKEHEDPKIRSEAAWLLASLGFTKEAAIALVAALADEEIHIAHYLPRVGQEIVVHLYEAIASENDLVRANAMEALMYWGMEYEVDSENFYTHLDDDSILVRMTAAAGIGYFNSDYDRAYPILIEGLQHGDVAIRRKALHFLGFQNADYTFDLPLILTALADVDLKVRFRASELLVPIGEPAVPGIIELLMHDSNDVKYMAIDTLRRLGSRATSAILPLTELLEDSDLDVRFLSAVTLTKMGVREKRLLGPLLEYIETDGKRLALGCFTLGDLGILAVEALPRLREIAVTSGDPYAHDASIEAIREIEAALEAS